LGISLRSYIELLTHRGVARLAVITIVTRLTVPMLGLGLVLTVVAAHGSYTDGGLALSAFSLAAAFFSPVNGRMADRLGPLRVLSVLLAVNMAAYVALVVALMEKAPLGAVMASAFLVGGSNPPAGPIVRATWALLVPKDRLQTAFALDAVLTETMFVSGPLVVSGLVFLGRPLASVIVVSVGVLVGNLLLITTPVVRDRVPQGGEKPHYLGPLAHGQTRLLYAILVCDTFVFGSMTVTVPAAASAAGEQDLSGVLLSCLSIGSVIGGLLYGSRRRGSSPGRELALFNGACALLLLGLGQSGALPVIGLLLLGFGLVGGPRDTLHQLVLGDIAPTRYRTEAFAWMSTFMLVGYSIGTAGAGRLVGDSGQNADHAFQVGTAAMALAVVLSLLVRPAPAEEAPAASAGVAADES
jgi:MFS family permease